jgi:hypothetical protein
MLSRTEALALLNAALAKGHEDVYINAGVDEDKYIAGIEANLRAHLCEPYQVSAEVMEPGFPFAEVGESISGTCIAEHAQGYWLVYQEERNRFLCFWGTERNALGAHGVYGSPLYCWSA